MTSREKMLTLIKSFLESSTILPSLYLSFSSFLIFSSHMRFGEIWREITIFDEIWQMTIFDEKWREIFKCPSSTLEKGPSFTGMVNTCSWYSPKKVSDSLLAFRHRKRTHSIYWKSIQKSLIYLALRLLFLVFYFLLILGNWLTIQLKVPTW